MTTFGITDAGFVTKRLVDIKAEIEAAYRSAFGAAINLDARSPLGQIVGIHSERESLIWELAEQIYNSRYPDTAEGSSLDNLASISNVFRLPATHSHVVERISGTNGTVVPVGFVVSVSGNSSSRFATIASGTITGGYVDLEVQAESTGAVQAPAGTLTVIETPLSGVSSVTNALDATVGRETETDVQLRIRRKIALNRPGSATVEGIRNAILEVQDVIQASVIENDTGVVDSDGRPAHSVECVVSGGEDADVAEAIFSSKGAGIETYGTESESVVDDQGLTHTIKFSRPTEVPVYLRITITPNTDANEGPVYPDNGDASIETAVLEYAAAKSALGHDVVLSQFYTPINTVDGVFGILVEVSLNGSSWQTTNLTIAADELAVFDSMRTEVIS